MYSSKKVPKGSHRMPDGSIMKNKGPPQRSSEQKPKKQKLTDNCPDSSRCSQNSSLKYSDNLIPPKSAKSKKNAPKSKK